MILQKVYWLSHRQVFLLSKPNLFNTGAFRFGYGLYETTKILKRKAVFIDDHFQRLKASAKAFHFHFPVSLKKFSWLLSPLLDRLSLSKIYRFRIQLTPYVQKTSELHGCPPSLMTFEITEEVPIRDAQNRKEKWTLWISSYPRDSRDPLWHHKTTSLFPKVLGFQEIHQQGVLETVFVNERGYLCEGTTSNLFMIKGRMLYTPALENGLLNGITRQKILTLARKRSLPVVEGNLTLRFLRAADAVFITGSIKDAVEIRQVQGLVQGTYSLHPWIGQLNDDLQRLMIR